MRRATIGVIGGSGLYSMEGMTDVEEVAVETPFGNPSDVITVGKVEGVSMAFLPHIPPTPLPYVLSAEVMLAGLKMGTTNSAVAVSSCQVNQLPLLKNALAQHET